MTPFTLTYAPADTPNTVIISINCDLIEEYQALYHAFTAVYSMDVLAVHPSHKPKLRPRPQRVCRFCGEQMPKVSFRREAHILSQLLGNRNWISDMECDDCNGLFSVYENDLANFIGITRTLGYYAGSGGIPKYKAPDGSLELGKLETEGLERRLRLVVKGDSAVSFNEKDGEFTLHVAKHTYTPLNAYKALLKTAYMLLPQSELSHYTAINNILRTPKHDSSLQGSPFFRFIGYFLPGNPLPSPVMFCYKKRAEYAQENYPDRVFVVYFQNYIYQLFLPFCTLDDWIYKGPGEVKLPRAMPWVDRKWIEQFEKPIAHNLDMSSNQAVKGEEQRITLVYDQRHKL